MKMLLYSFVDLDLVWKINMNHVERKLERKYRQKRLSQSDNRSFFSIDENNFTHLKYYK